MAQKVFKSVGIEQYVKLREPFLAGSILCVFIAAMKAMTGKSFYWEFAKCLRFWKCDQISTSCWFAYLGSHWASFRPRKNILNKAVAKAIGQRTGFTSLCSTAKPWACALLSMTFLEQRLSPDKRLVQKTAKMIHFVGTPLFKMFEQKWTKKVNYFISWLSQSGISSS